MNKYIIIFSVIVILIVSIILILKSNNKPLSFKSSNNNEFIPNNLAWNPYEESKLFWNEESTKFSYWKVSPLNKNDQFDLEIYDLNLNKILSLYNIQAKINELQGEKYGYSFELPEYKFICGVVYASSQRLSYQSIDHKESGTAFLIPKMVKPVNLSDITKIGDTINLYGFNENQKIKLTCSSVGDYAIQYDAVFYDNNKIIRTGDSYYIRVSGQFEIVFDNMTISGGTVPGTYQDKIVIGIKIVKSGYAILCFGQ